MMRHGQSEWNLSNRFTGWVDVPLTSAGEAEARRGGAALKAEGFQFDGAYTSVLKRAIKTCWLALEELDQMFIPITNDWRLNERHYGSLSGLNKAETTAKHGEEQVTLWRRSYDVPPPAMDSSHPFYPGNDRRYKNIPAKQLPMTESTASTGDRVVPFWNSVLKPAISSGKNLLIVAHGNSLRALIKHIDGISNEEIVSLNVPTGVPLVYTFDANWKPIKSPEAIGNLSGRYVGDRAAILAEIEKVAHQAKKK
jgi:2,3-bisphosphoglycerate-dependent phosphoglycerate mutase